MQLRTNQSSVLWRQVWGLSAILAAVMFSWMAYGIYQPKILQDLGFIQLATCLGIIQGFLGAVLEPLVGAVSDQIQQRFGSRLPIITTGVTIAGLIFVAVAILLQWKIPVGIRPLIPVLMTVWVMSMIIFRGPVVALLRQAAPLTALPQANMLLTIVFGLVGALSPIMNSFLTSIGGSITFILGAISLTVGATILYVSTPKNILFAPSQSTKSDISLRKISIIFIIGLGIGLEINLLLRKFPLILHKQLPIIQSDWIVSAILLTSALSVIPITKITMKLGAKLTIKAGMLIVLTCFGATLLNLNSILAIGLIVAGGIGFALIFESQIPLILGMLANDRAGLGTGLYFGGMGAAGSFTSILLQSAPLTSGTELLYGTIVLFVFYFINQQNI
ncbi:MAG: MFS transporter [Calothrix sp. C42_A2020_038]|nr:MFS transporter [Calothrix sp. C42_A2020_038]